MKRINGNARRWKKSSTPDEMARWSGGSGSIKPDEKDLGSFVDQNAALSCSWRDAQIESENERALHERSYTDRRDTEVLQRSTSDRVTRTRKRDRESNKNAKPPKCTSHHEQFQRSNRRCTRVMNVRSKPNPSNSKWWSMPTWTPTRADDRMILFIMTSGRFEQRRKRRVSLEQ